MLPGVWSDLGVQWAADTVRTDWVDLLFVGLYENDWTPYPGMVISMVHPCTFSGYVGLRTINSFNAIIWDGTRATLRGPSCVWTRNTGPRNGFVFGWYVVNASGVLISARRIDPPAFMRVAGQAYGVVPELTLRSEFQ